MRREELRRESFLARSFSQAETAAGLGTLRCPLGHLTKERFGLEGYIEAVEFRFTLNSTNVAATMPEAMPGQHAYAALRNIVVESEKHQFLNGVDGRDLVQDYFLKFGKLFETAPTDIADADATTTRALKVRWQITDPAKRKPFDRDKAIPLRLFDEEANGENGLRMEVQASIDGFLGVTVNHLTILEVWVDVVWLTKVRYPTPHRLFVHRDAQLDLKAFPINGRIEYLAEIGRINGANGSFVPDHSGHTNIELDMGDEIIYAGRTPAQIVNAFNGRMAYELGVTALNATTPEMIPYLVPQRHKLRAMLPKGKLRIVHGTRPAYATARFLISEIGTHRRDLAEKWAKRLGAEGMDLSKGDVVPALGEDGKGAALAAELDHVLVHPNLKSSVARKKAGGS